MYSVVPPLPQAKKKGDQTKNSGRVRHASRKKRVRRRRGKPGPNRSRVVKSDGKIHRTYIGTSESSHNVYVPPKLPGNPGNRIAARFRLSDRWYEKVVYPYTGVRPFPYINELGQITGHILYYVSCSPSAYLASVVSTILNRIEAYARKHNHKRWIVKNAGRMTSAAYLYATTKNVYLWDRFLFCLRDLKERGALIHRIFLSGFCKASDSVRFVYSYVSLQTKWLMFRAERPRDKLASFRFHGRPERGGRGTEFIAQAMWDAASAASPI